MPRIRKNDSAQVDRRRSGIDRAPKTFFHQARNPAAMIEMRMREDDCIDLLRSNRRIAPIALTPFLWPLKQAAINQDL